MSSALAVTILAGGCGGRSSVVVHDEDGKVIAEARVPDSGRFALEYRHSYYEVAARETFSVDGEGFRMVEIASPSEAVLDYYELAGSKRRNGWMRLIPDHPQHFERLPLIATPVGRRTLEVGGERYPLYGAAPRHVTIEVED